MEGQTMSDLEISLKYCDKISKLLDESDSCNFPEDDVYVLKAQELVWELKEHLEKPKKDKQ